MVVFPLLLASSLIEGPAVPVEARVRPLSEAVSVEPGATCLDPHMVTPKVITYLGKAEVDARIDVEVMGDARDDHRVAFLVRKDGEVAAERAFDFPSEATCDEIHAVVSVAVALAIDATLLEQERPQTRPEPADVRPEPVPSPRDVVAAGGPVEPRPEPAPIDWHVAVALEAGATVAAPPPVGGVGALAIEVSWRGFVDLWVMGLGGSAGPQDAGAGRAVFSIAAGGVGVCGGRRWPRIHPRGCVGALAGAALATGQGFEDDASARVPWVTVLLGADVRFAVASNIELGVGADALVHAVKPAFDFVDDAQRRRLGREFPPAGGLFTGQIVFRLR